MNWKLTLASVVVIATVALADPTNDCNNKCKEQKDGESGVKACQSGCTMYNNKDSDRSFFGPGFFGRDFNEVMIKCTNDCRISYQDQSAELGSCIDGCGLMRDISSDGQDTVFDFGNGGIRISFGSLPEMPKMSDLFGHVNQMVNDQNARFQRLFGGGGGNDEQPAAAKEEEKPEFELKKMSEFEPFVVNEKAMQDAEKSSLGGILQAMQSQMHSMVQNIFGGENGGDVITEQRDENGKLVHGGGQLVVIKSGPGYHSERTYQLGPDADIEKILMNTDMNDMMNHKNPIEQYLQQDQVEVFDPEKAKEENEKHNAAIRPASSIFDTDPWGLIKKKLGLQEEEEDTDIHVMDLEEPRLPETGLRSRHLKIEDGGNGGGANGGKFHQVFRFDTVDVCRMDRSKQSWSEWANCLHVRMGVPNWLLVITVAMGVVFTLWLCLIIPSNAPKQRIRQPKNIDTKELEANTVATVMITQPQTMEKVDLPPSYEDIVSTKVPSLEKELETKIVLCEEDLDIVEPLPQKVNLDEDRNCSNV